MQHLYLLFITLTIILGSCSSDPLDIDVSEVDFEMKFDRFDQEMFSVTSVEQMQALNLDLIERGGELYEFYVGEMLRSGSVYDDSIAYYLNYFVSDTVIRQSQDDVDRVFSDFSDYEQELNTMFKRLKFHLAEANVPSKLITYNSAFNYGVISTDSVIGLGLEMYLGENNEIISQLGFPVYMKEKMAEDYMLVDIAHSWIATNVLDNQGETFLDQMIYYGKLRYLIDAMLPELEDHLKMRYTEEEYDFSLASENDVWLFIMDMNWVYSTDMKVGLRFFEEAPTTVGIDGSPGRLGQFMGWQMMRQYMEKNPELTVADLIAETNSAKFLKTYKPENE